MSKDFGNRYWLVAALSGLGSTACGLGAHQDGRGHLHEALGIARAIQSVPSVLSVLGHVAELLAKEGNKERAAELSVLVSNHPLSQPDAKDRAVRCLASLEADLSPDVYAAAVERGTARDLDATVRELLADTD